MKKISKKALQQHYSIEDSPPDGTFESAGRGLARYTSMAIAGSKPPKRKRSIAGDGSFFRRTFRRADGSEHTRWICEIVIYDRGQSKRKTFYGDTAAEVRGKRDAYKATPPIEREQAHDKRRLDTFLDHWLQTKRGRSPSTLRSYEWICREFIKPFIGAMKLSALDALDIENLFKDLEVAGKSTRTIRGVYVVLRAALNKAVRERLMSANPIAGVEPPRHLTKKIAPLTRDQAKRFLNTAREDCLYALYVLALSCGLRQGELFGLKWSDVNFRSSTLAVRRQVVEHPGKGAILADHTKSQRDRSIKLPPAVLEALHEHRKRVFAEGDIANEIMFTLPGPRGRARGLLGKSHFIKRSFHPLLAASDLRCNPRKVLGKTEPLPIPCCDRHSHVRFHDLRHTAATLAFEEGVHPKQVQEMLGHASIALTLDTYSAFIPTMQDQMADAMQRVLFGA